MRSDGYHGILVDKDRQFYILLFKKGKLPWIYLKQVFMIRVVHPDFEILSSMEGWTLRIVVIQVASKMMYNTATRMQSFY